MIDAETVRQAAAVLLASWPLRSVADGALHEAGDQLAHRVFTRLQYGPDTPTPDLDDLVDTLTQLSRTDPSFELDLSGLIGGSTGISSVVGKAKEVYSTNITGPITTDVFHIGPGRSES
jgi:hypothetical protein